MDKSQFEFCALLENQTEGTKNSKCVKFWFLHVDLEFNALKVYWNFNSLPCCTNPHNLGAQAICIWSCYVLVESLQLVVQLFPFLLFRSAQETLLCKMGNLQKMQQKFDFNAVRDKKLFLNILNPNLPSSTSIKTMNKPPTVSTPAHKTRANPPIVLLV